MQAIHRHAYTTQHVQGQGWPGLCGQVRATHIALPQSAACSSALTACISRLGTLKLKVAQCQRKLNPSTRRKVSCLASVSLGEAGEHGRTSELLETLQLGLMFGGWYLSNIVFNIYNKEVLKVFPMPITCTTFQFLVGSLLALTFWATGIVPKPKVSRDMVLRVLPLAVAHTLGNLLTNVSLGAVAVSFTHTIKAMEPAFSVMLSTIFLGDRPHPLVLLSLLPIMGGVAMASLSEATFNWLGFLSAMGSNLTFQSRNVLSKKLMIKKPAGSGGEKPLDNISLFAIITMCSFTLLLPVSLLLEGWKLTPAAMTAMGIANPGDVIMKAIAAGMCFHAYQQVSYMILSRVSPVTHSIGNCVKRVVVIVASVLFFRNPMTLQSAVGTAVALAGVTAYSMIKRATAPKQKAE